MSRGVEVHAPCPDCGQDAIWHGTARNDGGTVYHDIACDNCGPMPTGEEE